MTKYKGQRTKYKGPNTQNKTLANASNFNNNSVKINISNYKNLIRVTGLFSGVHGLNIVLNLVRNKIASELLGPGGFGLNGIYNETRELIHSTTNCGMDIAGIRGISQIVEQMNNEEDAQRRKQLSAEIDERISLLRSWIVIFAVFGSLVCLFLAEPISWLASDAEIAVDAWGCMLLAPAVGMSTLTCGELTILKATRRIKALATVSVMNVVLGVVVTWPFYQFLGISGVLPALTCLSLAQFAATSLYSYRNRRPKFCFERIFLRNGLPMMKVGVAFVLTNLVSHGTQLAIRSWLNVQAGNAEVGLYLAGYSIAVTYGSVIFASLDNDFYPRLTGVFDNPEQRRQTVWRQIRFSLALAIPFTIAIYTLLPWLLPLLNSDKFIGAEQMARFASIGLIFRAIYTPLAYIPLAAGHSRLFMTLEFISYAGLFACVIGGYSLAGLDGAGVGLTVSIFIDTCVSLLVAKLKYKV